MKTMIIGVVTVLFAIFGLNNQLHAQTHRDDRGRTHIRTNVTIGTPNVRVHYSNHPHRYYHHDVYYRTRYVQPVRREYYHREYREYNRRWVPGYYDADGYWISGHWRYY